MFFVNDCDTTQHWRLRGHAKRRFWQWMSGWSRAIRKPGDLGFEDGDFVLPKLEIEQHLVPSGRKPIGLLVLPAVCWADQRAERNATVRSRCEKVAELAPADRPFIAWCHLNAEGDLLEKLLPDAVQVAGKDDDERKEAVLSDFVSGNVRVLVTKPKIGGFGLNLQHCSDLSYFPSYSWEAWYQVVRRCWRFGQRRQVNVRVVATEAESRVSESMWRKEKQSVELYDSIIREMSEFQRSGEKIREPESSASVEVPAWL